MKTLTRIALPALAAIGMAGAAATPAAAQYYGGYDRGGYDRGYGGYHGPREIRAEIRNYERRINQAARSGQVSTRNANWLSYRLQGVEDQFYRFRRGGFDDWEIRTLNHSLQIMERELQRRSGWGRGGRWNDRRGDYRDQRRYRGARYRDYDDDRRGRRYRDDD